MENRKSFDRNFAACRQPASFFTSAQQMAVFTEDLYVYAWVSFPFLHTPARAGIGSAIYAARYAPHIRTHPGDSPEHWERACQLRGNRVHDWITRGCNAIELRLLVRHRVGGRGWRQHLQTASTRARSLRPSRLPSVLYSVPSLLSSSSPRTFIFFSGPVLARDVGPKRAPN